MPRSQTPQDRRKATLFLGGLLCVTLVLTLIIGYPFLRPLAYALILATVFHPLHAHLRRKTNHNSGAALLSTLIIFLLIIVPAGFVLNVAAIQAVALAHGLAQKSAMQGGFVPFLASLVHKPLEFLGRFVDVTSFNVEEQISEYMKTIGMKIFPTAAAWVGNIFALLANVVLALITCYFLLRDGDKLVRKTTEMLPISDSHSIRLLQTLKNTIIANVQGVFAVGAAQGIATGLALAIMGVSPATLLGILAAFCSIVPVVGTGLVWFPAAMYLIAAGHVWKGIALLGLGAGVISMLDNIIRPLIVSSRVQANGLVLMLSMLGGVQAFGFVGLFVGPVVVALLMAAWTMLREEVADVRRQELDAEEAIRATSAP